MTDIKELRNEIDETDMKIKELYMHRLEICDKVALYKKNTHIAVKDTSREDEIVEKLCMGLKKEDAYALEALYRKIFEISRERQQKILDME